MRSPLAFPALASLAVAALLGACAAPPSASRDPLSLGPAPDQDSRPMPASGLRAPAGRPGGSGGIPNGLTGSGSIGGNIGG